jgi:hypothetical protein
MSEQKPGHNAVSLPQPQENTTWRDETMTKVEELLKGEFLDKRGFYPATINFSDCERLMNLAAASLPVERGATQTQSAVAPLTYEQEVHAILCASAASVEDLLRYFKAQAANEKGDAKKLTQKCIDWKTDDLQRIRALIPQALERRDRSDNHDSEEATHGNQR